VGLPRSSGRGFLGPFTGAVQTQRLAVLDDVIRQLDEYFEGKRRHFELPLDLRGTDFQLSVWRALGEIPFGETWSYRQVADRVERPRAVRAVGAANAANPVAIILPCHRVIASDGKLAGYAGGVGVKRKLLAFEKTAASEGLL